MAGTLVVATAAGRARLVLLGTGVALAATGLGALSLGSLLAGGNLNAAPVADQRTNPLTPRIGHFPAKAKQVIYMFMAGGPSQLELFDNKPKLQEYDGKQIPESYVKNKRFAFIKRDAKLLASRRKFVRCGQSGAELSTLLPHLQEVMWAVATRTDPEIDIDIIKRGMGSKNDPMFVAYRYNAPYNSKAIIDACRPWLRRDTFPIVARSSKELDATIRAKWAHVLPKP